MNYNRAAMKQEVKQAMRQTRPHPIWVTLLYLVIVAAVSGMISWLINLLFPGGNILLTELIEGIQSGGEYYLEDVITYRPGMLVQLMVQSGTVSLVAGILTTAWNGLMSVGYSGYCLDMSRGANPGLEHIFDGFPRAGSVILSYILAAVFTFLWSLLFGIGLVLLYVIAAWLITVSSALAAVGLILSFVSPILYAAALIWAIYRYVMVPFVIIDSQTPLSAMDAIRASKAIMKGRKGSFFVLRLSFIGWYLPTIIGVFFFAGFFTTGIIISDYDEWSGLMMIFGSTIFVGIALLVQAIINLWLTPYCTGCEARFYTYATGGAQPVQPSPYQPGPYSGQSGMYGGQPGPYNNNPYNYNPPPGQSFGGYTQAEQPPQYGAGTYTQWSAPQAPAFSSAEPPAAPATPAAPEAPAFPQPVTAPLFPGDSGASEVPAEPDSALYEAPYAESEAPSDDAPQKPGGPSYPQY